LPTLSAERAGQQQLALIRAHDQLAFSSHSARRRRRSPSAPQWHIYAQSAAGTDGLPPAVIPTSWQLVNNAASGIEIGRRMGINNGELFISGKAGTASLRIAQNAYREHGLNSANLSGADHGLQREPGNNGNRYDAPREQRFQLASWVGR
jgi:hypothetical protein